jgi:hypothetical protein
MVGAHIAAPACARYFKKVFPVLESMLFPLGHLRDTVCFLLCFRKKRCVLTGEIRITRSPCCNDLVQTVAYPECDRCRAAGTVASRSPTVEKSPSNSRMHNTLMFSFFVQQSYFGSFHSPAHRTLYSSTIFGLPVVGFRVFKTRSRNSTNVSTSYDVGGSGCRRASSRRRLGGITPWHRGQHTDLRQTCLSISDERGDAAIDPRSVGGLYQVEPFELASSCCNF